MLFDFRLVLDPYLVTPSTTFHPLHQGHGLPVGCGHRFHGSPGNGMFARLEFLHPLVVAGGTGIGRGNLCLRDVFRGPMVASVADRTIDLILAMFVQLPVVNDPRSYLSVTLHTDLSKGGRAQ